MERKKETNKQTNKQKEKEQSEGNRKWKSEKEQEVKQRRQKFIKLQSEKKCVCVWERERERERERLCSVVNLLTVHTLHIYIYIYIYPHVMCWELGILWISPHTHSLSLSLSLSLFLFISFIASSRSYWQHPVPTQSWCLCWSATTCVLISECLQKNVDYLFVFTSSAVPSMLGSSFLDGLWNVKRVDIAFSRWDIAAEVFELVN